ncbi:MAG TPA: MFS transporter [Candidatus Omnitrophota bacterium]|nr:MFS transporter [Candidatus Omnitrophota bacterium]
MSGTDGAGAALRSRDFRLLWIAQGISQTGDSLTWLALILTINRLTGSTTMIATLSVVLALPQLVLGLLAGVMADRWNRRRTMIGSDLLRAGIVLGFLFVRGPEDLWLLYLLGLLHVVVSVFFSPARAALTPALVAPDGLLSANSLLQTTQIVSGLAGTALAGVLVPLAKSGWPAFALDALSFAASAACVAGMSASAGIPDAGSLPLKSGSRRGVTRDLRDGLSLVFGTRALRAIMMAFGVASLGTGAVGVLFVPFLVNTLHLPAASVALAKGAQIAGLLIGGAWVARSGMARSSAALVGGGLAGIGLATVLLGASPSLAAVLGSLFLLGLCATPMQSATNALLQRRTPNAMLGRVEATVDTLLLAIMMGSMAWAGVLADRVGIRAVLYGAGVLCLAGGAAGWALLARVRVSEQAAAPGEPIESG